MRGEISSGSYAKRHPLDWYVEPEWCTAQLIAALGEFRAERLQGLSIWDPCCGRGHVLAAFQGYGLKTHGSDLVRNLEPGVFVGRQLPPFVSADFLELDRAPAPCSIVCNPPYSYKKVAYGDLRGLLISEAFARHALQLATGRVCLLLPSKWLASQSRYRLFTEHPPFAVLHLCQRPSMPPGDRIAAMGNRAFRGGMTDYCWIVWNVEHPTPLHATQTVWLPPLGEPVTPVEARS
jgi:hypothetical protein